MDFTLVDVNASEYQYFLGESERQEIHIRKNIITISEKFEIDLNIRFGEINPNTFKPPLKLNQNLYEVHVMKYNKQVEDKKDLLIPRIKDVD